MNPMREPATAALPRPTLSQFVYEACLYEAAARKLGNVHPGADFADMTFRDFARSAWALAQAWHPVPPRSIGQAILAGVEARRQVTPVNTNLGIILLLAPLAVAYAHCATAPNTKQSSLRESVAERLLQLDLHDAQATFRGIELANPAGLGDAPEADVRQPATCTLLQAMKLAEDRDRIAWCYSHGFEPVWELGLPALVDGLERFQSWEAGILHCQLIWLSEWPDSHLQRKWGESTARIVQAHAGAALAAGGYGQAQGRHQCWQLDQLLRTKRWNPGTTADLVTATIFLALLEQTFQEPNPRWSWAAPASWWTEHGLNRS